MSLNKQFGKLFVEQSKVSGVAISDEGYELMLYAENDGQLYKQRVVPIHKNLNKKKKAGKFDIKLAAKLFRYFVVEAAKKYAKENASGDYKKIFSKKDIDAVAEIFAKNYDIEYEAGNITEETVFEEMINIEEAPEKELSMFLVKNPKGLEKAIKGEGYKPMKHYMITQDGGKTYITMSPILYKTPFFQKMATEYNFNVVRMGKF
jgi:hypothetical protein